MKCVVFAPGILGSELENSDFKTVWPPKLSEIIFGYDRIDELMAADLTPTRPIRNIGAWAVYRTLLEDIERCGYTENGAEKRFVPFGYDWRQSNATSAAQLVETLDAVDEKDPISELILLGHSMGGLVLRYLLESGHFNARHWFQRISALITFGTPHFGAPEPLVKLRGEDKTLGVSGEDLVKLANDPRFPSLYQLIAAPGSALTLEKAPRGDIPRAVAAFSPGIVQHLGLKAHNIQSAQSFWAEMGIDKRPEHVDYFFFGGASHKTASSNVWNEAAGNLETVERRQSGDGSVPVSCSVVPHLPHGYSEKIHKHVFADRQVRESLYRFLGAPSHIRPQSMDRRVVVGEAGRFGISVDKETYTKGQPIEIVASYTEAMTAPNEGFDILSVDPDSGDVDSQNPALSFRAAFEGVSVTSFSFVIMPQLEVGLYELKPSREVDDPEPTLFFVVDATDAS